MSLQRPGRREPSIPEQSEPPDARPGFVAWDLVGQRLSAEYGATIGRIDRVYLDEGLDQPEWVTVETGMSGPSFVPLVEATKVDSGVRVPYSPDLIRSAALVELSDRLTDAEKRSLYSHYDVPADERRVRRRRWA